MSLTDLKSAVDQLPIAEFTELSAYIRRQEIGGRNGQSRMSKSQSERKDPGEHWRASLDDMAADPDIRRELMLIEAEFGSTEADGLKED